VHGKSSSIHISLFSNGRLIANKPYWVGILKKFKMKHILRVILALLLLAGFQNCTGGFKVLSSGNSDGVLSENSSATPTAVPSPFPLFVGNISELQSVTVKIDGAGIVSFPSGLPKGALYDQSLRRFNWIPTRGQAGNYNIKVFEDGKEKGFIGLSVAGLNETQLHTIGPPFIYSDGDVGYIFVHGRGDLDRCANPAELAAYWGSGPATVEPDPALRLIACYDGRKAVADTAAGVAQQILNANCGKYNKCIIFTHSMGGLMLEHMFTHTRAAVGTDPVPSMFANKDLYQAVKDRTLFVVSLASAAGGSVAASVLNSDGRIRLDEETTSAIGRLFGANDDSIRNLVVSYATHVVAPITEDPGVPFFMVPGFTEKTAAEAGGIFGSLFDLTFNNLPRVVFNSNRELALLDSYIQYRSRSDGLIDLRGGCGIASDREDEGPGRSATLDQHFRYCWSAPKKPNHYVWFLSNLNHYLITGQSYDCRNTEAPCVTVFPDANQGTFIMDRSLIGLNAMEVARLLLNNPAPGLASRGLASIK
jgi:hypothetical protein